MKPRWIRRASWLAPGLAAVAIGVGACGSTTGSVAVDHLDALTPTTTTIAETESEGDSAFACEEGQPPTESYTPLADMPAPGAMPEGSFMQALKDQGFMRVGVDENTAGLSALDPVTGVIDGFEVQLAHEIAERIFGAEYTPDVVVPVPVVTREKRPFVAQRKVDLTISAVTMECDRWNQVLFSAEYYTAVQQLLMPKTSERCTRGIGSGSSPTCRPDDLQDARVCVTASSSSEEILVDWVPGAVLVPVPDRMRCLVLLQDGSVDAYFGHDTFQFGMLQEDPTVEIRPLVLEDPTVTDSHYGIAIHHDHLEFVRFVNGVLDEIVADGTWAELYEQHLVSLTGQPTEPPTREYRDD